MCKHHSISFEYITPYASTPFRSREIKLGKKDHSNTGREREREMISTLTKIAFLNKRYIYRVWDRCSIRFWYKWCKGKIVTTEKTCFVAWYKKEKTSVENPNITFIPIKEIADVFFTSMNSICYICLQGNNNNNFFKALTFCVLNIFSDIQKK